MEKEFHKEFPELMAGKKIMYVHGFASSAQSGTVALLRQLMPQAEVVAEDLPLEPQEAMALLRTLCEEKKPDLIIGSSAGGMYAEMLYGFDRILVNPAFQMGDTMAKHGMIGKNTYQNPRKDGVQEFIVTKALVKEYAEMTTHCFSGVDDEERLRVYGMFGDQDPLVHTFDLFRHYYPQAIRFHGEHHLIDKVAIHYLVPVIRWIDDKQNGRERPILYIAQDALADPYGKPKASLHKAYEKLIEDYSVFFVCPAPTDDHAVIDQAQSWIEEYVNAPAYDRVAFINQRSLLYGDYLITTSNADGFMGTTLQLGSPDFKTWDEIITFFERLGGQ